MEEFKNKKLPMVLFSSFNYDQDSLNHDVYPYAMICYNIDDNTMIAVGVDPMSPVSYKEKNMGAEFIIDLSIEPKNMLTMDGKKTVYYAKKFEL
jgi:hypothetical protein